MTILEVRMNSDLKEGEMHRSSEMKDGRVSTCTVTDEVVLDELCDRVEIARVLGIGQIVTRS